MTTVSVKIKNIEQIQLAFLQAPVQMSKELNKAIRGSTYLVEQRGKKEAPVITGDLRRSIQSRFSGTGINVRGIVEPLISYGGFVHDGTKYQKANPYLARGVEQAQPYIDTLFTKAVKNALNSIARKAN